MPLGCRPDFTRKVFVVFLGRAYVKDEFLLFLFPALFIYGDDFSVPSILISTFNTTNRTTIHYAAAQELNDPYTIHHLGIRRNR